MSHPVLLLIRPEQSSAGLQVREKATCDGTDPLIQPDVLYRKHLLVSDDTGDAWQHSSSLTSSQHDPAPPPSCHQPTSSHHGLYRCSKIFPSNERRERTRGHDNKNLCEHFHEKRECYVENMSRHVSYVGSYSSYRGQITGRD